LRFNFFPMKILVVGYACNPYGGSEPGVGWTAVCRIARSHDVCVLTDIHNKAGWDQGETEGRIPSNVKVRFLRDRSACSENRFIAHLQSWLNYRSFNHQVLAAARAWHAEEMFDLCHQVTIAGWRMPSPLWQLPVPFVWGPIGGAGYIPSDFRSMLSPAARLFESARDINTFISSRSKAFRLCIRNTAVVFAANEETELFLKPFRGERPLIRLPIASLPEDKVERFRRPSKTWLELPSSSPWLGHPVPASNPAPPLRLFAGGNMEGRKGLSLALKALAIVKQAGVDFHYTIAGGGPEIPAMKILARQLGLENQVEFHQGFSGDDYLRALHSTDVYFLPSFRESTPVTLLEAYLAGCYPVVADTSAQGEIVRLAGGHAVPVETMDSLIEGLAQAILWCAGHRKELPELAAASAMRIADHFSSDRYDATLERAYEIALY
jgi:glycosyltransferase involved in cell wall biosynthesis